MSALTVEFGHGSLNPALTKKFNELPQGSKVLAEYVWIGGTGLDYRCKTKVLDKVTPLEDLPIWNYDGSSTGQAPGHDSEVLIKPAAVFNDPFRGGNNILVLCETYQPTGPGEMKPLQLEVPSDCYGLDGNNSRAEAVKVFENPKIKEQKPWYGIEQEYTLFYKDGKIPLGWPADGSEPGAQGPYYCSAGVENSFGRDIADAHLKACIAAGVTIAGTNGEVMPGQWEYQVGPCEGIDAGDHMIMSRYLLQRVCEIFGVRVTFHPKPMATGDWNGAGCHTNYSTLDMRSPSTKFSYTPTDGPFAGKTLTGGFAKIIEACDKLGKPDNIKAHIDIYGPFNDLRLTGKHETASIKDFSYGVANRGASIRIPRDTEAKNYGYLEDRRPASNMDPYKVAALMAKTTIL